MTKISMTEFQNKSFRNDIILLNTPVRPRILVRNERQNRTETPKSFSHLLSTSKILIMFVVPWCWWSFLTSNIRIEQSKSNYKPIQVRNPCLSPCHNKYSLKKWNHGSDYFRLDMVDGYKINLAWKVVSIKHITTWELKSKQCSDPAPVWSNSLQEQSGVR